MGGAKCLAAAAAAAATYLWTVSSGGHPSQRPALLSAGAEHLQVSVPATWVLLTWLPSTLVLVTWSRSSQQSQNRRHCKNGAQNPSTHPWLILRFPCVIKVFILISVNRLFQIVGTKVKQIRAVLGSVWPNHNVACEKKKLLAAC